MKRSHGIFGILAILSAAQVVGALVLVRHSGDLEALLIAAPLLLAPALIALRPPGRWRTSWDGASRAALLVGAVSFGLLLSLLELVTFADGDGADLPVRWSSSLVLLTSLVGVGTASRSWIVARARQVPWVLALIGLIAGLSYTVLVGGAALGPLGWTGIRSIPQAAWNVIAPLWATTHVLFAVWLGTRFLIGRQT